MTAGQTAPSRVSSSEAGVTLPRTAPFHFGREPLTKKERLPKMPLPNVWCLSAF